VPAYDGSIRIDTKIDEKGFNKGVSSMKSQVLKLAAEYRKAGLTQSEAMKKAWAETERTAKKSSKGIFNQFKKDSISIENSISGIKKSLIGILTLRSLYLFGKDVSELSTTLEASMIRVKDIFADASDSVVKFAENNAFAIGLSRRTAYEYASIFGNLFSTISDSTEENSKITIEMLNSAAVVASKTGRTMEDVLSRIRSGVLGNTEAIEDLGINVNVALLESTEAFRKFAGDKSWEQLDFKVQQQIRVMAILEQAHEKFGDEVQKSSALVKQKFGAALDNLKTIIGNVVNYAIIPLIEGLTNVLVLVEKITAALFGDIAKSQGELADTGGKATKSQKELAAATTAAGKAAKKSLAAFDDLNVLQTQTATSASGAASAAGLNLVGLGGEIGAGVQLSSDVENVIQKIKNLLKPLQEISLVGVSTGLERIGEAIKPITKTALEGLRWLYTDVLVPLSTVTLEGYAPILLDVIARNIAFINKAIEFFRSGFEWFWNFFLEPIMNLNITKPLESLSKLNDFFNNLPNLALSSVEGIKEKWEGLKDWFFDYVTLPTAKFFVILFQDIEHFSHIAAEFLKTKWESTKKWFKDYVTTPLEKFFVDLWNATKLKSKETWKSLKNVWNTAKMWFEENVTNPLTDTFNIMWDGIKLATEVVFEAIGSFIKGAINGWIGMFESFVNFFIDGVNDIINALNKIEFDVPDWVPGIGGQGFGVNISNVKKVNIPKLAEGATIQPNNPFMAMLGDQPSGINIETPLDTMLDAFRQALSEQGSNQEIVMQIDADTFARIMVPHNAKAKNQVGVSLISGGGF